MDWINGVGDYEDTCGPNDKKKSMSSKIQTANLWISMFQFQHQTVQQGDQEQRTLLIPLNMVNAIYLYIVPIQNCNWATMYASKKARFVTQRSRSQGAVSIRKTVLPGMAIPMLKIRRPNGRLIFNMEIAIRR